MHRIDTADNVNNRFADGNPLTGQEATICDAAWLNGVQENIAAVIEAAGLSLIKGNDLQLYQAILALIAGGGAAVTAEGVSINDAAGYFPGLTNVEEALQLLGEFKETGTFDAARFRRQVIQLSGAAHDLAAGHYERVIEISHASACTYTVRPDADVAFPIGGTITIFQAGGGKVEIVQGAGVTVHKGASFNRKTLEQHASLVLVKVAANTWRLGGMLEAAA